MSRARAAFSLLARAILQRLLLALLAALLAYGLTLWAVDALSKLAPARVPDGEAFQTACLIAFGTPELLEFGQGELLPFGAAYPLTLYALVLRPPRRRRLGWWLLAWLLGVSSALMGALSVLFASGEFREMVQSGAFPLSELLGSYWTVAGQGLLLGLRSGTLALGFPLAVFALELTLGRPSSARGTPGAASDAVPDAAAVEGTERTE